MNMGSANDSVIICEEKQTKTPRRNPIRQARINNSGLGVNSTDNATNIQPRTPLRTVYESSSCQNKKTTGCYELSKPNERKRTRESGKISSRKRRKTIDLCETIVLSDDESEDKKGNQRAKGTPLYRTNGTSDVLLLNPSEKDATPTNKYKKKLKKKRRKSGLMTKKSVGNTKDDDVAVVWTSSTNNASNKADVSSKKTETNQQLYFVDVVGDTSNFHKRSLNRNTKYTLPSQKNFQLNVVNDKCATTPSTSQLTLNDNQMFNQYLALFGLLQFTAPKPNVKNQNQQLSKPKREIIVDGLNVTYGYTRNKDVFSKTGLELVLNYFLNRGHDVKIFLPQHTRNRDREFLENWYVKGYVIFTPSRKIGGKTISSYDDRFILDYATKCKGIVVSSDQYRDLWQEKPEWRETIESRLLIPTFVGDYVMFPDDPLGRSGPTLNEFLRH